MREHIVRPYEEELALLDKRIAQMGGLAEKLLGQAFDALERRDPQLADSVVQADKAIDRLQKDIEEQVVSMIARRQPMADDLRNWSGSATSPRTSPSGLSPSHRRAIRNR